MLLQVGGVGAAAQSTILEFQLNARRDAVVDFHPALRSAGHPISSQYAMVLAISEETVYQAIRVSIMVFRGSCPMQHHVEAACCPS